jgi:cytochrome c5
MKQILIPSLFALLFVACGSDSGSSEPDEEEELPPVINCSTVQTVPKFSQVLAFQQVCTNCHVSTKTGAARNGAPADINFDQYASAMAHAEQASIEVNVGAMPPEGSNLSLTAEQKTTLYDWALCGTPQ